jgi:hypothetical protein
MDIAAVIATGRRSAVLSATADRDELEKRLVGCLLSGDCIINLDNVNGLLRSDLLCQATTAEAVKVRPLGSSDHAEVPNSALWAANGNNLSWLAIFPAGRCSAVLIRGWSAQRNAPSSLIPSPGQGMRAGT